MDAKEYVRNKYKQNQEKVLEYKHRLQEELEAECVLSGGHYFYDWVHDPVYSIGGDILRMVMKHILSTKFVLQRR